MEGLASYVADDESDRARMVLRDAVLSGLVPPIASSQIGGYFAYRFGHAAFSFIEETWGADGVRDFIFEFRSALGSSVEKALKRAFDISVEEFDARFRRWLEKKYLPLGVNHGQPVDFGERVRLQEDSVQEIVGAAPSPSGDLAAAFAIVDGRVEVVQLGLKDRQVFRNLSAGRTYGAEYPIVQFLTTGPLTSRDLVWSPDGNLLAYFVRRERGRDLVLVSALDGQLVKSWAIRPDQPLSPVFAPDGKSIVFRGIEAGRSDIFRIDVESGAISNLTSDDSYDASPVISPDGKWLYWSASDAGRMKIFRMLLADPSKRERVTDGDGNDEDASFSPDGRRLFFSSSRSGGIYNIFSLDLENGEMLQWTDVSSGVFAPSVVAGPDGDRLLFTGYFRRKFDAWVGKLKEPVKVVTAATPGAAVGHPDTATPAKWVPEVDVPIDPAETKPYGKGSLFVENADISVGVTSDQRFYSRALISWADLLGNRRAIGVFDSLSTFTNYQAYYLDLTDRLQKGLTAFYHESFYVTYSYAGGTTTEQRDRIIREAGVSGLSSWPFDRYHRLDVNLSLMWRTLDVPLVAHNSNGNQFVFYLPRDDKYPQIDLSFVGDSTEWRQFGPWSGRRWELASTWGQTLTGGSETIRKSFRLDWREYFPVTARTLFATRVFAAVSGGAAPDIYYFGGLDTLRGYDYAQEMGTRIAYANAEFRFPLVDEVAFPIGSIGNIRGRLFLDLGGAWLDGQTFQFWNSDCRCLEDGLSSYGWGISWNLGGLELHWDFSHRWDLAHSYGGTRTSFWIGQKF